MVKAEAIKVATSIGSLKLIIRSPPSKLKEVISGFWESGVLSNTEFWAPGVPPSVAFEAVQLASMLHDSNKEILSNEKPPSSFSVSLYQSLL